MKHYLKINVFILTAFCAGCATNGESQRTVSTIDNRLATTEQAAQTGQRVVESGVAATQSIGTHQAGLAQTLVNQLGVSQQQALGGAGAIFQAAKRTMEPQSFTQLSQSVPGMNTLLNAAPAISNTMSNATGGLSSVIGGTNNTLTGMASLAASFEQLNLSPNMVSQFVPIVTNYVRVNGGQAMANLLQSALAVP